MDGNSLMDNHNQPISLLRRLAIIFYDALLLMAVLLFATALVQPWLQETDMIKLLFRLYLLLVCFIYFSWQWLHGGQTLPMRTWHVKLRAIDPEKSITFQQVIVRFAVAILSWAALGLGFLWALVDKQQRTWHDWASKTHLVYDTTPLY